MAIGVISFDIDGVLVDASKRLNLCLNGDDVDWSCFLDCRKLVLDLPKQRNIELVSTISRRGYDVVVITGRPEHMRKCTELQLRSYGVVYKALYMRLEGDTRRDHLYKVDAIIALRRRGIEVLAHFDDNEDTVKALKAAGIDAILIY